MTYCLEYVQEVNHMLGIHGSFKKLKKGVGEWVENKGSNHIKVELLHWNNYYIQFKIVSIKLMYYFE